MLTTLLSIAIFTVTLAAPAPVECFLRATADPGVFPVAKEIYRKVPGSTVIEEMVRDLCAGATEADDPVTCFRESMANDGVMATTKKLYRGTVQETAIETAVARLCSSR